MVVIIIIIIFNEYFTSFCVKHFELPLCTKCAILNLPCLFKLEHYGSLNPDNSSLQVFFIYLSLIMVL